MHLLPAYTQLCENGSCKKGPATVAMRTADGLITVTGGIALA